MAWNKNERHFQIRGSSSSHPRAVPPMTHAVILRWPNIAPKARARACCAGRTAGAGPGLRGQGGQAARRLKPPSNRGPVPRSLPEPRIPGTLPHKRRGSPGERVRPRGRDTSSWEDCGTRSRGQRTSRGPFQALFVLSTPCGRDPAGKRPGRRDQGRCDRPGRARPAPAAPRAQAGPRSHHIRKCSLRGGRPRGCGCARSLPARRRPDGPGWGGRTWKTAPGGGGGGGRSGGGSADPGRVRGTPCPAGLDQRGAFFPASYPLETPRTRGCPARGGGDIWDSQASGCSVSGVTPGGPRSGRGAGGAGGEQYGGMLSPKKPHLPIRSRHIQSCCLSAESRAASHLRVVTEAS